MRAFPGARRAWLACLALAIASACAPTPDPSRAPRLLVSIDTFRADHAGAWGAPYARTPAIDRLARRGVQVRDAISPAPLTLPSHATMLTGVDPPVHGLRDNGLYRLGETTKTLAERLPADVPTAGFIGGFPLVRTFGLARGFDVWDDTGLGGAQVGEHPQRPADQVTASALEWLRHRTADPRPFAFVHLYDPHFPYEAPPPWTRAALATGGSAYDAEAAFVDRTLGTFLARVEEMFATRPFVIVTADHGESLGDHGEPTHANFVYDATQRVPLLLAGPGVAPALETRPRRLADVCATVLDLYGIADDGRGCSLRIAPDSAPAYVETMHPKLFKGWSPLHGARTERWKYIRAPRPELYDLLADPAERTNVLPAHPDVVAALGAFVDSVLAGESDLPAPGLSEATRRQLAALGYVSTGDGNAPETGKDPKDGIAATAALFRGQQAFLRGDLADAEIELRRATAEDPSLKDAHAYLAGTLLRRRRFEDAAREAGIALGLDPHVNEAPLHTTRGEALLELGRAREAVPALEAALQANPADTRVRGLLERAHAAR